MTHTTTGAAPAEDRAQDGPADPFDLTPWHRDTATGAWTDRYGGAFSVAALAPYFTVPGLIRDLHPVPVWQGLERVRRLPGRPAGTSDPAEFTDRFRDAVARAIDGHATVAVALSGGMDSAALLNTVARLCRADGRRVVAVVLDVDDDAGRGTGALAARQLDYLHVDVRLERVPMRPSRWPEPPWDPAGPRFDAWPRLHVALAQTAADQGATVLLRGDGADELLGTPPFLAPAFLRAGRPHAARRYLADQESSFVGEALPLIGRIRSPATAQLYWATRWPGYAEDRGAPVLADPAAVSARRWLAGYQERALSAAIGARATWAEAAYMHRLFPLDALPDAGVIEEASPYLDAGFAAYAYDLPLTALYAPDLPNSYLRGKALVAGLLPTGFESVLTSRRQLCLGAYRRYWTAVQREPRNLVALGLLRPDWRAHCRDALDLAMIQNCEAWVSGALARGAEPVLPAG